MGLFSSSKKVKINEPGDMSPLEAVTHLFAAIQIADQQASFEEKESWINAITSLFPEHSFERAEKFFSQATGHYRRLSLPITKFLMASLASGRTSIRWVNPLVRRL